MLTSNFLRSSSYTAALNRSLQHEKSVKQGVNSTLAGLEQMGICLTTIALVSLVLQTTGYPRISDRMQLSICSLPFFLGISLPEPENPLHHTDLQKWGMSIQNHVPYFCITAATVSALAMIYLGYPMTGISTLAHLLLGHLVREGVLPLSIRHAYNKLSLPLAIITGMLPGEPWVVRLLSFIDLWKSVAEYLPQRSDVTANKPVFEPYSPGRLTPGILKDIASMKDNDFSTLKVNRNYITKSVLPPIPNIESDRLLTLFDEVNWEDENESHGSTLASIVKADQRYILRDQSQEPSDPREYARHQLELLITSIIDRTILAGEPDDDSYALTEDYLKLIAQAMEECTETDRVNALMRLSVEAGNYCGPAKLDLIEAVCLGLISELKSLSFTDRILLSLERIRQRQFMEVYHAVFFGNPFGRLIGWLIGGMTDRHNYHGFQNLVSKNWGIRQIGAEQDAQARASYVDQLIFTPISDHNFWHSKHTATQLIKELACSLRTPALKLDDYIEWWQKRIDKLPEPDAARLVGEIYDVGTIEKCDIKDQRLLAAMLFDIGILRYYS